MTHHHHHVSMEEWQQEIRELIRFQGFAIRHVMAFDDIPEYTYTVGLHKPGTTRPELFMSGLSLGIRMSWMHNLGLQIQGPPSPAAQRMAKTMGISVKYPKGGRIFHPGVRYTDLTGNGLSTFFGEVEQQYYEAYFGQAIVFHGTPDFPVLQVVWPDTRDHFPFDPRFARRFKDRQRLLFDPQRYLPLRESEDEEDI